VNICRDTVSEYLDVIEDRLCDAAVERSKKLEELTSIDEMQIDNIVSAYVVASNQAAYLRALAMALVRASRQKQCAHLADI